MEATTGETEREGQIDARVEELAGRIFDEVRVQIEERRHLPTATYRLQFNRYFTFEYARKLLDYLERLGVSDIYASPYFRARADSLHGYDIVNHNELNPEIGTQRDYDRMVEELQRRGMFQVLDTVPNHMGIGACNAWWMDVLENGRASIYAPYFDVEWEPLEPKLSNKVLLPVLGGQYGTVLENGELRVSFLPGEGRFLLNYYENIFPISARTYAAILGLEMETLLQELGPESEAALEYQSILTAIDHLPPHHEASREKALERNREKEVIKRRLAALSASEIRVREHIERNVQTFNGTPGDPRSFDHLDALLERQPYRLSFWRVATEEINYRRFFDINELAAVRVDEPVVFEETHRLVMSLLAEGKLHGLRIDHVDGLLDPAGYFNALQRGYFLALCRRLMDENSEIRNQNSELRDDLEAALLARFEEESVVRDRPLYVVVEKILARGENLPSDWAVYGTTGYEFTNAVNGLFVDSANAKAFDELYHGFIGEKVKYADLAYESKQRIMRLSLSSEVNLLTNMLNHISEGDRHSRDFTINSIRNAIREVIACFPVYRTYIDSAHPEGEQNLKPVETAVARAKRRNPAIDPSIFDFLRDVLMLKGYEDLAGAQREARLNFVLKFQQVTGPVVAKGIEDTSFYVYNRLVSLNEVGGEPDLFGISPSQFHAMQAHRQRNWPFSMLTTGTHDTKRSEDVRARIDVLSEMPGEWRKAVRRWARFNRKHKRQVEGQSAPSANEEYFLYQNLLGVWPFSEKSQVVRGMSEDGAKRSPGHASPLHMSQGEPEDLRLADLQLVTERMQAYMRKAMNEAKVNTSWVNPNEAYQQAVADFIAAILKRGQANRFLPDFVEFQRKVAHYGAFNSLSQVLLKIAGPGVPDIYQGNELWDLSLVDPDNRRPVDYATRRKLLAAVEKVKDARGAAALVDSKEDGRIKLLVTMRALRFRRENKELFAQGAYTPIEVEGTHHDNIIAFARTHQDRMAVVVTPRLLTRLARGNDLLTPVGQVWSGSWLPLPGATSGERFRNVFSGETLQAREHDGAIVLPLEEVLRSFPVALLEKME